MAIDDLSGLSRLAVGIGTGGLSEIARQMAIAERARQQSQLEQVGQILTGQNVPAFARKEFTPEQLEAQKAAALLSIQNPVAQQIGGDFVINPDRQIQRGQLDVNRGALDVQRGKLAINQAQERRLRDQLEMIRPLLEQEMQGGGIGIPGAMQDVTPGASLPMTPIPGTTQPTAATGPSFGMEEQQALALKFQAAQMAGRGDILDRMLPGSGGRLKGQAEALNAQADILLSGSKKQREEEGKAKAERLVELRGRVSKLPELEATVKKLDTLADQATYTGIGLVTDFIAREIGAPVPKGADARKEYVSTVDNQILPLLRETFGAQFTAEEGKSLKNTLGDPGAHPTEKKAVLNSFITQKYATIASQMRELGMEVPEYITQRLGGGGQAATAAGGGSAVQAVTNPQGFSIRRLD